MAIPVWYQARTGVVYVGEESAYGTVPTLASTDAVRHTSQKLTMSHSPRPSPERHGTPDQRTLFFGRKAADGDLKALMYPSGTLNTLPELKTLLKNSFAAPTNITLSTTVASGAATTGAVVASATGLAVGQPVQITMLGGSNPGVYVRWLTSVAGTTLVWAPALPFTCAASDLVKGCAGWAFETALAKSLTVAHYPQAPSASTPARELNGWVLNKMSIMFDANLEPVIQFSGPGQKFAGTLGSYTPQAKPAAFTTVGAEASIPSGLVGYFQHGAILYQIEKMQVDIDLSMDQQNTAFGTSYATGMFRRGKRSVTVKIDAKVADDLTLWTPALAMSSNACMLQIGATSGYIWGVYMPALVFTEIPDIGDDDETNNFSFAGEALATSGNDNLFLAMC